jgi:hypothetical protein
MKHPTGITTKKARHVSMNERVKVKLVLHLDDYTDEEFDACYYSPDEIAEIRQDVLRTVRLIEDEAEMDHEKYCRLGLERCTRKAKAERLLNRTTALVAVLQERSFQRWDGVKNEYMLLVNK